MEFSPLTFSSADITIRVVRVLLFDRFTEQTLATELEHPFYRSVFLKVEFKKIKLQFPNELPFRIYKKLTEL